jgi:hypothetical protein
LGILNFFRNTPFGTNTFGAAGATTFVLATTGASAVG